MTASLADEIDLLAAAFNSAGIARVDHGFAVETPWALARYGEHVLRGGWWALEWEGAADPAGLELRLSSPAHPLIVVPGDAADFRLHLEEGAHWHVALLVSPWPGRKRFSKLRLKRLGANATVKLYLAGAMRLLKSDRPIERVLGAARRVLSGRTVGVRVRDAATSEPGAQTATETSAPMPVCVERDGLVAILDQGDELHPRAFELAAQAFAQNSGARVVYADRIEGGRLIPRPEWDEELAGHGALTGSPVFVRAGDAALADQTFGACDILKAVFNSSAREHGSITAHPDVSRDPELHSSLVVLGPDLRRDERNDERDPDKFGEWNITSAVFPIARIPLPLARRADTPAVEIHAPPVPYLARTPKVSVIIPTKTQTGLLEACLNGLIERTGYPDLEVIIVDNGVDDPRFPAMIETAKSKLDLKLIRDADGFNFPRLIHSGVKTSGGEIVLLLNDDIEARETGWLHRLVESALRPDIGAVGARLLYPDGTIQHAGCILGIGGGAGHMWKGADAAEQARNPMIALPGRRMAVTGACLAVRREVYDRMGGLDQANFPVAFNDIDFCLRLHAAGLKNLYRGDAVLTHHESKSRGADDLDDARRRRLAAETARFLDRWRPLLDSQAGADPYGSPAFDPLSEAGLPHRSLIPGWG